MSITVSTGAGSIWVVFSGEDAPPVARMVRFRGRLRGRGRFRQGVALQVEDGRIAFEIPIPGEVIKAARAGLDQIGGSVKPDAETNRQRSMAREQAEAAAYFAGESVELPPPARLAHLDRAELLERRSPIDVERVPLVIREAVGELAIERERAHEIAVLANLAFADGLASREDVVRARVRASALVGASSKMVRAVCSAIGYTDQETDRIAAGLGALVDGGDRG